MTQVLFALRNKTNTSGVWIARIDKDLRDFCPRAYGRGIRMRKESLRGFGIRTLAINFLDYTIQIFKETKS